MGDLLVATIRERTRLYVIENRFVLKRIFGCLTSWRSWCDISTALRPPEGYSRDLLNFYEGLLTVYYKIDSSGGGGGDDDDDDDDDDDVTRAALYDNECGELLFYINSLLQWTFVQMNENDFEVLTLALLQRTLKAASSVNNNNSNNNTKKKNTIEWISKGRLRKSADVDFKSILSDHKWTCPTFMKKHCANIKKTVNQAGNDLTTQRYATASVDIHRRRKPGVDWCRRVAILELIREHFMRADVSRLYLVSNLLLRLCAANDDLLKNIDFLCLVNDAQTCLVARCSTQLLELNEPGCFCRTKCFGLVGASADLERYALYAFNNSTSVDVCGMCRLSMSTCVKRTYSSSIPGVSSCSDCAATLCERVQLTVLKTRASGLICFSHRFYTSCSKMFARDKPTGGVMEGVCFGERTCKRRVRNKIRGQREENLPPFNDIDFWFTCKECRSRTGITMHSVRAVDCLSRWMRGDITDRPERICVGCRVAARCRHYQLAMRDTTNKKKTSLPCKIEYLNRLLVVLRLPLADRG